MSWTQGMLHVFVSCSPSDNLNKSCRSSAGSDTFFVSWGIWYCIQIGIKKILKLMKITGMMCTQDVPDRPPKCQSWQQVDLWHSCQSLFFHIKLRGVKRNRTQNGCRWELCGTVQSLKKRGSEGGVDDGKRESSQSVDQSLQAWPLSGGVVLGARSQACCHAEAFTGTQRQIGSCWHQVASLIHPSTASAQPSSLLHPRSTDWARPTCRPDLLLFVFWPQQVWSQSPTELVLVFWPVNQKIFFLHSDDSLLVQISNLIFWWSKLSNA